MKTIACLGLILAGCLAEKPAPKEPDELLVVSASYPGADPKTVASAVAALIEGGLKGADGCAGMVSHSRLDGSYELTIALAAGADVDAAQIRVQDKIALAEPRLPEDVRRLGVTVRKRPAGPPAHRLTLSSPGGSLDAAALDKFAASTLRDELARLPHVADVVLAAAESDGKPAILIEVLARPGLVALDDLLRQARKELPPAAKVEPIAARVASARLRLPDDASTDRARDEARRAAAALGRRVTATFNGPDAATLLIDLAGDRPPSPAELRKALADGPRCWHVGTTFPVRIAVLDPDELGPEKLRDAAEALAKAMRGDAAFAEVLMPGLGSPTVVATLDRAKLVTLGVTIEAASEAARAASKALTPAEQRRVVARNSKGDPVPVAAFASFRLVDSSPITRVDGVPALILEAEPAEGTSAKEAATRGSKLAEAALPKAFRAAGPAR